MGYTVGTSNTKISCFSVYVTNYASTADSDTTFASSKIDTDWVTADLDSKWCGIGKIEVGASFMTENGNSIETTDCDEIALSKISKVEMNDINVNAANYAQLVLMDAPSASKVTFAMVDAENGIVWAIRGVKPSININVTAGEVTKMSIAGNKKDSAGNFSVKPLTYA